MHVAGRIRNLALARFACHLDADTGGEMIGTVPASDVQGKGRVGRVGDRLGGFGCRGITAGKEQDVQRRPVGPCSRPRAFRNYFVPSQTLFREPPPKSTVTRGRDQRRMPGERIYVPLPQSISEEATEQRSNQRPFLVRFCSK